MAGQGPLDLSIIHELREIGDEHVEELVELFHRDATRHLATMKDALSKGNAERLQLAAHTLMGSSGSMGARKMPKMCFVIEERAQSGRLDGICGKLKQLEEEYRRVKEILTAEKNKTS
jgi:HPt (histidine-containing phosphotransfer) domain-containing protein